MSTHPKLPIPAIAPPKKRAQRRGHQPVTTGSKTFTQAASVAGVKAEVRYEVEGNEPVTVALGSESTLATNLINKARPVAEPIGLAIPELELFWLWPWNP